MSWPARRVATVACLLGLALAGGAMYTATRVWSEFERPRADPLPPETVTRTGAELAVWSVPAALVALAGVIAFVATSGAARRVVAVSIGLAGAGVAAAGVHGTVQAFGVWPLTTALLGCGVVAVAGWMTWRGASWPGMSRRYERSEPSDPIADDPAAMWDALDRGEDPTSLNIGQTAPGEERAR